MNCASSNYPVVSPFFPRWRHYSNNRLGIPPVSSVLIRSTITIIKFLTNHHCGGRQQHLQQHHDGFPTTLVVVPQIIISTLLVRLSMVLDDNLFDLIEQCWDVILSFHDVRACRSTSLPTMRSWRLYPRHLVNMHVTFPKSRRMEVLLLLSEWAGLRKSQVTKVVDDDGYASKGLKNP